MGPVPRKSASVAHRGTYKEASSGSPFVTFARRTQRAESGRGAEDEPTGLELRNAEPCQREGAADAEPCTISCKVARCQAPATNTRAATVASWRPSKAIVELRQPQQAASRSQARDGEAKDISAALSRELCQGEEARMAGAEHAHG